MESKCHKAELSVFKAWGKEEIIGCKTECTDGNTFFNAGICMVLLGS